MLYSYLTISISMSTFAGDITLFEMSDLLVDINFTPSLFYLSHWIVWLEYQIKLS